MFLHPVSDVHHGNVGGRTQADTPFLAFEVLRNGKPRVGLRVVRISHVALCNDLRTTEITQPSRIRAVIARLTRSGG
ncbi:hypothetical protein [Burkholderia sp. Ac-20392]|uniref:hypothetical protein n=1 Tax=Burkholderia sp. Ac-20392 TaxID=2703905 RepID=UPI00197EA5AA|nr:hypothetical protein [Burkholderia sp. Ac-20392]MBN3793487.1 hypothetical protein [Burkholderia sp. Ac-20392]